MKLERPYAVSLTHVEFAHVVHLLESRRSKKSDHLVTMLRGIELTRNHYGKNNRTLEDQAIEWFKDQGPKGATEWEMVMAFGWPGHGSCVVLGHAVHVGCLMTLPIKRRNVNGIPNTVYVHYSYGEYHENADEKDRTTTSQRTSKEVGT